uniref:Putative secreted protein n=1 Tax=Amblyomma americanum TaxID=6943 RepID=A0A0C9SCR7_AMBAM
MCVCAYVMLLLIVFLLSVCLPCLFHCLFLYTYAFYCAFTREMNTCHPPPQLFYPLHKNERRRMRERLQEKSTKKNYKTLETTRNTEDDKHLLI